MIKYQIHNQSGEAVGEAKLPESIFGVAYRPEMLKQVVDAQLASNRQSIANTKGRGEVSGSGRKPWRQKGTGRARVGSLRTPVWRGGGVVFGPKSNSNFTKNINKKMKQQAWRMVLSDKVNEKGLILLDKLVLEDIKTKELEKVLRILEEKVLNKEKKAKRSLLLISADRDDKIKYSGRNLPGVKIINLENINVVDLLKYKETLLTSSGVKALSAKYK